MTDRLRPERARTAAVPNLDAARVASGAVRLMRRAWQGVVLASIASVAMLAACGGGGDGGVGSNGTGVTLGTVNGFGSIIIDGVHFLDSDAVVRVETGPAGGVLAAAEARLGQRARVETDGSAAAGSSVATQIEIEPALVGQAEAPTAGGFRVLGQRVELNFTTGDRPVTVLDGYTSAEEVAAGDWVEVHAVQLSSEAGVTYLATRVEKVTEAPGYLRATGIAGQVTGSGAGLHFRLGALDVDAGAAVVRPSGAQVVAGATVSVFAPPSAYEADSGSLVAGALRVRTPVSTVSAQAYLSGAVSRLVAGTRAEVDGVAVDLSGLSASAYELGSSTALREGDYVRIRGLYRDEGTFLASQVTLLKSDDDERSAELRGTVIGYVAPDEGSGVAGRFFVRDTAVLQPVGVAARDCSLEDLVEGRAFVEVRGVVSAAGVTARSISCEDESRSHESVVSRSGTLGGYSSTSRTFTLSGRRGTLAVLYSGATVFVQRGRAVSLGAGEAMLAEGGDFEVEGTLSGSTLKAQKIKAERRDD